MSKTARAADLRVDLILRVERDHSMMIGASQQAPGGERWKCRCGKDYKGDGALRKGRRHVIKKVLSALDNAARVA